jgi:hypothetical protein
MEHRLLNDGFVEVPRLRWAVRCHTRGPIQGGGRTVPCIRLPPLLSLPLLFLPLLSLPPLFLPSLSLPPSSLSCATATTGAIEIAAMLRASSATEPSKDAFSFRCIIFRNPQK